MFRRVLCSLSLAASIVIVSSASSYGVTPNGRQIAEAAKIAQKIIQKKKPLDAWKTSGQLIKTSGEIVRDVGTGAGLYCLGTKQAPPCPRSDSSDNKTNSQPKRVFENATHNFQKPNPLLQGNGVFQASPLVGERFGDLKMKPTHNLQKPNPLLQGNGF
ncbi:MAG: hypothetical protein AN481_04835 [Aphanizomenon flos-aquae LD13]|jgi:hypothetical protein|uniref:Uncharacterized protein n=1 Tax=Aphanizomenon flos-aquae LD13 TaxID=1710894 RepID=A0A1B7VZX5_APHFL|nr:hypothetical protein [Aphanizomenon flos-aquae UKL13-PB]OBQ26553.1 MAG: hypothetical protein AN481_04835 [Aphanizomenon flos-aquae LD13]HCQ20477.1 hypothetical protein [Anabaena sp. UBA12330]